MKKLILAIFVMLTITGEAWAYDARGKYSVKGTGLKSCGAWVKNRKKDSSSSRVDTAWMNGFLSAYNRFVPGEKDVARGVDMEGWLAWIDNYCHDHPLKNYFKAAMSLIKHLNNRQR